MDHKTRYKLAGKQQSKRLKSFSQCNDPSDVSSDIALTRALIERAVESGSVGLAGGLLATLGRLTVAHTSNEVRRHDLLHRSIVIDLARGIVSLLIAELRSRDIPDWESIGADVAEKMAVLLKTTTNTKLLEGPHDDRID